MLKRLDSYYYTVRVGKIYQLIEEVYRDQNQSFEGLENQTASKLTDASIDKLCLFGDESGYIYGSSVNSVRDGNVEATIGTDHYKAMIVNANETFLQDDVNTNGLLGIGLGGIPNTLDFNDLLYSYSNDWTLVVNNHMPDIQQFKRQLRIDDNVEDLLIWDYIEAAQYKVEDATSISIGIKNFEETLTTSYNEEYVYLAMNPVISIDQVILIDSEGVELDITADYSFRKDIGGYKIKVAKDESVVVTYKAGIVFNLVPKQVIQAMKLIVTDMFEHRGDVVRERATAVKHLLNQVAHKRF